MMKSSVLAVAEKGLKLFWFFVCLLSVQKSLVFLKNVLREVIRSSGTRENTFSKRCVFQHRKGRFGV